MNICLTINTDNMPRPDEPECEVVEILQHIIYQISGEGSDIKTACDVSRAVFKSIYAEIGDKQPISLSVLDVGTVLDALELREESWKRTIIHFEGGTPDGEIQEECTGLTEAETMRDIYTNIIKSIREQITRAEGKELEK